MGNEVIPEPDLKGLFESGPGLYMVLDPNLRVVAASKAYLQATLTRRADIVGRHVLEVFPGNPGDPTADAVGNSHASFLRVLPARTAGTMVGSANRICTRTEQCFLAGTEQVLRGGGGRRGCPTPRTP